MLPVTRPLSENLSPWRLRRAPGNDAPTDGGKDGQRHFAKDLRIPYKPRAYPFWKSQSVVSREQSPNFRGAKYVHPCRPSALACVANSRVSIGF